MAVADADVVVVGSGASGVQAAYALVEAGLRVRMLDLGHHDTTYESLVPSAPFPEVRRRDRAQHRYFLGDRFEGVTLGRVHVGAQLTPSRRYVSRDVAELTPVVSRTFFPLESLAAGGLANAWGAVCPSFDDRDLAGLPITRSDLSAHYDVVAARIGINGARDDLLPFLGELQHLQPPLDPDDNAASLLESYRRRRARLHQAGFFLGQPRLAVLTVEARDRRANAYHDMDFWSDHGRSVYRPRWTLDELRARGNFEYRDSLLVERFGEPAAGGVEVLGRNHATGERERHRARALVLAAGTLGTARIVLRSLGRYHQRVPIVCNPHTYAPMVNLRMLGRVGRDRRHSLAQLCFVYAGKETEAATVGHVYGYRSLLGFKLIQQSPLPARESLRAIRLLLPAFTIVLIQHADVASPRKYCSLRPGAGDAPDPLEIEYEPSRAEAERIDGAERAILRCFRKLGCVSTRRIRPGHAASIHYAGTFPMTREDRELTTDLDGRLRGTSAVYLADGSSFGRLPAKALTFTMMANANRIGVGLTARLRR